MINKMDSLDRSFNVCCYILGVLSGFAITLIIFIICFHPNCNHKSNIIIAKENNIVETNLVKNTSNTTETNSVKKVDPNNSAVWFMMGHLIGTLCK